MTDEQVEKIIKSNMMLQMNLAGIRADFEEALQRKWVGLTDEERYELLSKADWAHDPESYAVLIETKLKEKNNA